MLIFRFELRRPDATFNKGRSRSSSGAVVARLYLLTPVGRRVFSHFPDVEQSWDGGGWRGKLHKTEPDPANADFLTKLI